MGKNMIKIYEGKLLEEQELTLKEFCIACDASHEEILEMVLEGILEHRGRSRKEWRFTFHQVERYRKASRLRYDLDINIEGVALILDLLDRIDELEARIRG